MSLIQFSLDYNWVYPEKVCHIFSSINQMVNGVHFTHQFRNGWNFSQDKKGNYFMTSELIMAFSHSNQNFLLILDGWYENVKSPSIKIKSFPNKMHGRQWGCIAQLHNLPINVNNNNNNVFILPTFLHCIKSAPVKAELQNFQGLYCNVPSLSSPT